MKNYFKFYVAWITFLQVTNGGWIYDFKKEKCAIVFSEVNFGGQNTTVANGKQVGDLSVIQFKQPQDIVQGSGTWDNKVASLIVEDGCRLKICTDTHLEGSCQWVKDKISVLDQSLASQVSSIGCGCPLPNCKAQKCENIHLRENECGRGFFESNCNTCNGEFLTIRKHELNTLSSEATRIKSIYIKSGCTFTAYAEEDLESESAVLTSGYGGGWNDDLASYKCVCDNTSQPTSAPVDQGQDTDAPPLINIPLSHREIMNLNVSDHPGVSAALTSMRHNRSPRNAYILVIGLTGSGKSTSINFLFDSEVAKVGNQVSVTKSIHEYRIPVQVDELGCKNCELRVIDTPGFGDTEGIDTDAAFLAGLEEYLYRHEELKDRIPNIVLVFSKFSDNRIGGRSSPFVKTLRGIELFKRQLFDPKYSNVVTVLTHFMSELRSVQKNPAPQLNTFREIIQDYTTFTKPIRICVAENRPEERGLPMINGYYKLPNKEYFPQNIFEKIQEATGVRDPIGEAIIRSAFKHPENFRITEHTFGLRNTTFTRETHFLSLLNAGNFNINKTEISNITETIFRTSITSEQKRNYPGSLEYLQRVLNLRGIFTSDDIPRSTVGVVELFKNMRHNPLIEDLLQKAFGLKIPEFISGVVVGQSFDILRSRVLSASPFETSEMITSDIGYKIPNILVCKLLNDPNAVFHVYNTREEYLKERLLNMKFQGTLKAALSGDLHPGFNTLEDYNRDYTISAVREFRLFRLTLIQKPRLSPEFLTFVRNLPEFNAKNHTVVEKWKEFFSRYGTHVVSSVFGGGGIGGKFKAKNRATLSIPEQLVHLRHSIPEFYEFLGNVSLGKQIRSHDIDTTNVSYTLDFYGGDFKFDVTDFSRLTVEQTAKILDGFEESLSYKPSILESSMEIQPIGLFLKHSAPVHYDKVINAAQILFDANLAYVPPPRENAPLQRPEVQKHIKTLSEGYAKNIEQLKQDLATSTTSFNKLMTDLAEQAKKERQAFDRQLKQEQENTKQLISVTCHFDLPNLKGNKVCAADMTSCLKIRMDNKVQSVNTHNSCVRYYKKTDCSGEYKEHTSNESSNIIFPLDIPAGEYFSLIRCDSAISK